MSRDIFRRFQLSELLNPLVDHSVLGAIGGLGLVALLVPVLTLWNGDNGTLARSIPLIFLVPVLLSSAVGGRTVGALVSIAATLVWDWFFIPPLHKVTVASAHDVTALIVFFAVALLTGQLANTARRRTREALLRAETAEALYELSMALSSRRSLPVILSEITHRLLDTFDLQASAVLLRDSSRSSWRTAAAAGDLDADLRVEGNRTLSAAASWVSNHDKGCDIQGDGQGDSRTESLESSAVDLRGVQLLPLHAGGRAIGVLQLVRKPHVSLDDEQERLLMTFANGVAIALEQERLSEEERSAELARESDRLKSALLSSVSHDLRTPLAGIKAAASSLVQDDVAWSEEDRRAFAADIDSEADRLSRLVSNLLDVSRIEAGAIKPVKEWEDLNELIEHVVHRLSTRVGDHRIEYEVPPGFPSLYIDSIEIEEVLTNLVENATKFSPDRSTVRVVGRVGESRDGKPEVQIDVSDEGPGIEPEERTRIFEKFYRSPGSERVAKGTGLGLAIVKGLVEAHGGTIDVTSGPEAGSTFTITLPVDEKAVLAARGSLAEETLSAP